MSTEDQSSETQVEGWDLHGWCGVVQMDLGQLRTALGKAHDSQVRRPLTFETVITPGAAWFVFHGQVGAPVLEFAGVGTDAFVSVRRVVSDAVHLMLGKEQGGQVREVRQVDVYPADASVSVESELHNCRGVYQPDGSVVLNWQAAPRYRFVRNEHDDALMASRFVQGLQSAGEPIGWLGKQQYISKMMTGARFRLYIEYRTLWAELWLYFAALGHPEGRSPTALPARAQPAGGQGTTIPGSVVAYFDLDKYTTEFGPRDLLDLPYVIYPYARLRPGAFQELPGRLYHMTYLPLLSAPQDLATPVQQRAFLGAGINPAMKSIQRGTSRFPLLLARLPTSNVTISSGSEGQVLKVDELWYYQPPPALAPAAVYDADSKTVPTAALKSSVDTLVSVDTVSARHNVVWAKAAYLVYNAAPTHYLRMSRLGERLQLTLCYRDKRGDEQVVDPADIEWTVLAGNGSVSRYGIFTQGNAISGCTALLAVEPDDRRWYWAAMIVPSLAIDELLELQ
ncbi:hypothetical protein [Pseudomonas sp. BP8]|uniref:hypothetical protein n=1 Tax=Pseudomonas sp. BP8 TaxID=2817864 RepID=UPI001AE71876|nr:hypothetical protein [Pseudomonas sp. BP8]MBP2263572.1 hypothetical protein [Pseudomonas sp. BP8]HDS1735563.1 hypothetical protein [Pseudomonas putida]